MEKHFQIWPYLRQIVRTLQLHDTLNYRQHPRRNSRNVCDILVHRYTSNLFHLFLKIAQQSNLLFWYTNEINQRIDIFNQDSRKVAHLAMLQVIVRRMASSKNQRSSGENTAIGILLQIKSHRITTTGIVQILKTFLTYRNEFALVVSGS